MNSCYKQIQNAIITNKRTKQLVSKCSKSLLLRNNYKRHTWKRSGQDIHWKVCPFTKRQKMVVSKRKQPSENGCFILCVYTFNVSTNNFIVVAVTFLRFILFVSHMCFILFSLYIHNTGRWSVVSSIRMLLHTLFDSKKVFLWYLHLVGNSQMFLDRLIFKRNTFRWKLRVVPLFTFVVLLLLLFSSKYRSSKFQVSPFCHHCWY